MDKERFSAFLLGLSVGVVISLLVAPKSGRETRASIRDKAGEGTEYLRQRGTVVKQTAAAWVDKGKEALSRKNWMQVLMSDQEPDWLTRAVQRSLHELDRLQCSDAANSEAISGVGDILGAIEAQNVGRE